MRFAFTEDQLAFRDAVREFLEKECTAAHVRGAAGFDRARWKRLAELGVVGMTAPIEHGGLGMNEVDLVLVLEECGRGVLPEPIVETSAVAIPLLSEAGETAWISRVVAGDAIIAVSFGGDLVAHAGDADLVLTVERDGVFAVPRERFTATLQRTLDPARRLYSVSWNPEDAFRVAVDERAFALAFDRAALGTAAQLLGIAARCIEMAAGYATERRQFGKPIGSFQAVKHLLANALVRLEFARPAVYRAADSVARDVPERSRDVSMAKALASDAAVGACKDALQVHGAIGYTEEHHLHLWLKRGFALANAFGDASRHRERVAEAVLG